MRVLVYLTAFLLASPCLAANPWTIDDAPFQMRKLAEDPAGGGDATISPDGRFFVTTSTRSGQMDLWLFAIETGTWTQLTDSPSEDFEARFSPDGRRLVFTSTRSGTKDIWLLSLANPDAPRPGEPPRRLTTSAHEDEYPIFSPDGRHVVYTGGPWGARDFWIVPAEGGTPRTIGDPGALGGRIGACSFDPVPADSGPDRGVDSSLVCHDYGSGTGNLVRLWLDGESAPLTRGGAWDYKPATSGDGRFVAFSRALEGPSAIWLMPAPGGRAKRLTGSADSDRWPTWSADGRRLFFHRLVDRGTSIEVLDRHTGETRAVSRPGEIVGQAALHPSGRELAYCALEPGPASEPGSEARYRIRIVDLASPAGAHGPRSRRLEIDAAEACWPRYFPGDASASRSSTPTRLAVAARPEAGARWDLALVEDGGADVAGPAPLRWITRGEPGLRGMDGPIDISPDGRRLVFHADTLAFESSLYLADLETGAIETLTDDAWFDEAPSFTADGRGVLFMSTRGGDWTWGLFRLDLGDRSLELFAGPDWVQKNHVRPAGGGGRIWSQAADGEAREGEVGLAGVEQIVVRRGNGAEPAVVVPAVVDPAGRPIGARWPAVSADGRYLAYTRVERRVEYWLVENPAGQGSPLHRPGHTPRVRLAAYVPRRFRPAPEVGGPGATGPEAADPPTAQKNGHAGPTPPGGLGTGILGPGLQETGADAPAPDLAELGYGSPPESPGATPADRRRSPVDVFHR